MPPRKRSRLFRRWRASDLGMFGSRSRSRSRSRSAKRAKRTSYGTRRGTGKYIGSKRVRFARKSYKRFRSRRRYGRLAKRRSFNKYAKKILAAATPDMDWHKVVSDKVKIPLSSDTAEPANIEATDGSQLWYMPKITHTNIEDVWNVIKADLALYAVHNKLPNPELSATQIEQVHYKVMTEIHNSSMNDCYVTAYKFMSRRDQPTDYHLVTQIGDCLNDQTSSVFAVIKAQGGAHTTSTDDVLVPYGTNIFWLKNLMQDWKVVKTKKFLSKPGDVHVFSNKAGRKLKTAHWYDETRFRRGTSRWLFEFKPKITYNGSTGEGNNTNQINTGISYFNVVHQIHWRGTVFPQSVAALSFTNTGAFTDLTGKDIYTYGPMSVQVQEEKI